MTFTRRTCRSAQQCQPTSLGEVIYCVLHHSVTPLRAIAEFVGKSVDYLRAAGNPDRKDTAFQVTLVAPVTHCTGNDALIEFLAQSCGGVFVRLPEADPGIGDLFKHANQLMGSVSAKLTTAHKAMTDRKVCQLEASEIEALGQDVIRDVVQMVHVAKHLAAQAQGRAR